MEKQGKSNPSRQESMEKQRKPPSRQESIEKWGKPTPSRQESLEKLGEPPSLEEQVATLLRLLSLRGDIMPPTLPEVMGILGKPPLQKKQIPILQRILTRNEINPPTLEELPEMLEKTPSLHKKIAMLRTFVSLRSDMKLQPHRGKIKRNVLKSAVHAVVFVGRLTKFLQSSA